MERTIEQWKQEINEGQGLVRRYVDDALAGEDRGDPVRNWAKALKEARRTESDLYRMAAVAGVTREQIDAVTGL